ncbi:lipoprotein-releasing system permease protein [Anseongella ginsenosidimutans]|uniref:Lipoprotein-releasing system permease protein n=1 Tax=Anseongella ginsenosidimutans TaxID=496056 RepID=A0A4R3KV74_9SPHI|nr:FtsX-like permease family protein [Anseongella ginsenosidimutans]QEC53135.1 ABC transporter permease [Anseongella ginsenosidimutans]TCS87757.1 lipoprotein-releasing system permease protein [Anseongella ginsenosidimutans]
MNFELFVAKRVSVKARRTFSRLIVIIGITGIALGLAVMISAFGIVTGFKNTIRDKMVGFTGHIQVSRFDLNTSFENTPVQVMDTAGNLRIKPEDFPGVKTVQVFATKPGIISAGEEIEGVVLKGVGPHYDWAYLNEHLLTGKIPSYSNDSLSENILISQTIAERLKLEAGDDLLMYFVQEPLRRRKLHISGIYQTGLEDLDKLYVIGDLQLIQRLNNWGKTQAGGYELFIEDISRLDELTLEVHQNVDENLQAYSVKEIYPLIFEWLSLLDMNAIVLLILMLLVAGINMISALLIMILERTNMIGILKALGADNFRIRKIFMYNAVYLTGIGMLIGNIVGLGFCFLQDGYHLIGLDQTNYYVDYVPVDLSLLSVVLLNCCTFIVCVLMLIIPSMIVSRVSPVKAIRFK